MLTRVRASLLLVGASLSACSTDAFLTPGDASVEASPDVVMIDDVTTDDVVKEGSAPGDANPLTFCGDKTTALFCDDFDATADVYPWSTWDSELPTMGTAMALTFVAGDPDHALSAAAPAFGDAFVIKNLNGTPKQLIFDMKLPSVVASTELVVVTVGMGTFSISTDSLGQNILVNGDSSSQKTLGPEQDGGWHHFEITFMSGTASVAEDGTTYTQSVPFALSAAKFTLDIGIVSVLTGGGAAEFDNVVAY
jgi:hypothetical protein